MSPSVEDLAEFDEVIIATGVQPRIPSIPGVENHNVIAYHDLIKNRFDPALTQFAVVGAGGIGFDVAEFLTQDGVSPTEDIASWKKKWGVSDPSLHRGGVSTSTWQSAPASRKVVLMQRSKERPGKKLGKTTGWIHRASLQMKGVKMLTGVNYEHINEDGILIQSKRDEHIQIEVDMIVLCTGQKPERALADELANRGIGFHLIGGADKTDGLDAKIAINQGTRLGSRL